MIGEGVYEIFVADRGGKVFLGRITDNFTLKIVWTRDDIGTCAISVVSPSDDACGFLGELRTVRHEIVVFRNGQRVWEGPITHIAYRDNQVDIDARDVAWYLSRRVMVTGFDSTGVSSNAVDKVFGILTDHYPPAGDGGYNIGQYLTKVSSADDARTAAKHDAYSKTIFEFLNHYADNGGVDFVVRGRRIIVFDTHTRLAVLPQLSDADFAQSLSVIEYGSELATRVYTSNNGGFVGIATAPTEWTAYYGNMEKLISNSDEGATNETVTEAVLTTQATRELERGYPAPVSILVPANIGILPTANVEFTDLMPGAWVPVASAMTCRKLRQWQRVDGTSVSVNPAGEVVSVNLAQAPAHYQDPL